MDTIDILLATYNGEKYLKEQLESIENQTYDNWHLIVRDDGSKDNTLRILKEFENKYPSKVTIINDGISSGGAKNNFFKLMNYSENEYIACCDQDDVWLENKLEIMYKELKKLENENSRDIPLLVHCDLFVVDKDMNIISNSFFDYSLFNKNADAINFYLLENYVTGCAMLFNRKLKWYMLKNYNLEKIYMHDWLAALIAYTFGKGKFINQSLVKYRQHGNNSVGAKSAKKISTMIANAKRGFRFARKVVTDTYEQAEEFYKVNKEEIDQKKINIINGYANLQNKNKISRLLFYKKYNIRKIGFIRKIWLIIFG